MKKALPYIVGLVLVGFSIVYILGSRTKRSAPGKQYNTRISLNRKDKNPYGAFVFHEALRRFFPKASFKINFSNPGNNDIFGDTAPDQLYVILRPEFHPTYREVDDLITFIDRGNNVFISTFQINEELNPFINAYGQVKNFHYYPFGSYNSDTMRVKLANAAFTENTSFTYPGISMGGYFESFDTAISKVMGYGYNDMPNLIHLKKGNGNLYIHLSPITLTNYFLLYKNNIAYFERIFSQFPESTSAVIWDEYFGRRHSNGREKGWFSAIMNNPYFRAGILTALALLLIYALTEIRRRQRVIPVIVQPSNDSLEFVKTMGLLYYEHGDHTNLAQKTSAYFLEHIRTRYKIFARNLDESFVKEVSHKSGVDEVLVKDIVSQMRRLNQEGFFSDTELIAFKTNIETFYTKE